MIRFPETKLTGYAFDVETTPNFFSVVFWDLQSDKQFVFYDFEMINHRSALRGFINQEIRKHGQLNIYGYNSKSFDMSVLSAYLMDASPEECYWLGQSIIGSQRGAPVSDIQFGYGTDGRKKVMVTKPYKMDETWWRPPYDLMNLDGVRNFDLQLVNSIDIRTKGSATSLKHVAIMLKWPWIKDLPYPHHHKVVDMFQVGQYIDYNTNDVGITKLLAIKSEFEIGTRFSVEKTVPTLRDAVNHNRSGLANRILEHTLPSELGVSLEELKSTSSPRDSVDLSECISDDIVFESSELRFLIDSLRNSTIDTSEKPSLKGLAGGGKFLFDDIPYQLGLGGLHTVDGEDPCVFLPGDDEIFIDGDVASFYPFIILNNTIFPEHLSIKLLHAYRRFVEERISVKKTNKPLADTLKIVVNSIFGKQGSTTHWLYDPKAMLSVTLNGQMALLLWVEMLAMEGIKVFSANTDGVTARVKHSQMDAYVDVCRRWSNDLNYGLEFAKYDMVARRDVNNYMAIVSAEGELDGDSIVWKPKHKVKQKGVFIQNPELSKAAKPPIIAKALTEFFQNRVSVRDTVYASTDIYDFCMSQKVGRKFDTFFVKGVDEEPQQKTIRWIYSNDNSSGQIVKTDGERRTVISTYPSIMTNDLRGIESETLGKVNRDVYVSEIMKIVNVINVVDQESLF